MTPSTIVNDLRCEHLTNPLGVDFHHPRLSWKLLTDRRGARQTAYQIIVASGQDALESGAGDRWDTGKVSSDQSVYVPYEGAPLSSGERAWWAVRVWDENGDVSDYSDPAWWEMGLLNRAEWKGEWIASPLAGGLKTSSPAPYLRKVFTVQGPVTSARLYVTALGVYECSLNGELVGAEVFAPGWTDYRQRVQYQVYDVADFLQPGDNAIGAILGDGWYCGYVGYNGQRQFYGDRPELLAQLVIQLADGTTQTIATDASWRTSTGPILESDMQMGESYDARREMPGWDTPAFDDAGWWPVRVSDHPDIQRVAMRGPAVRRIQEIPPVAEPVVQPGTPGRSPWVFDLGQNMVGWVRLKVKGAAGTTVRLRFAEVLNPDGSIYTENLRAARATDHYTLRGDGDEEVYEPHFTFHGFRYVELAGFPGTPDVDTITGIVIHSDMTPTGTFECSDPLVNQLQHNIIWGQKGNFLDVPTDCPQRDERLGWTGDAQVFIRTATHNFDVAGFFHKWQRDLADAQTGYGSIPQIAPNIDTKRFDGGPAWSDAVIICPWTIYQTYGDSALLVGYYDSLVAFMDYLERTSPGYIRCHPDETLWCYGDWLSINADTAKDLIGTAFFAYDAHLMAEIADVLGKPDDAARYRALFGKVRNAFIERFLTPGGLLVSQTQTACVLALHFNLVPDDLRPVVARSLVRDIEARGGHLSTGFVGSPYLPHVLTAIGRADVAYKLLHQRSWPSYLYSVTQGATTIWERWDGWTDDKGFQDARMNSFNHYAYGAVGAWLYASVGGIDVGDVGYRHIIMRPHPGGKLTEASATYQSLYGSIESHWHMDNDQFQWRLTVPPNSSATVFVPTWNQSEVLEGGRPAAQSDAISFLRREGRYAVFAVPAGSYQFSTSLEDGEEVV